jgi:hypothetical protein
MPLWCEADHDVLKIASRSFADAPITTAYRSHYRAVTPGDTYGFQLLKPEERDRDENKKARASAGSLPEEAKAPARDE